MKQILSLLSIVAAFLFTSCGGRNENGTFTISGKIKNVENLEEIKCEFLHGGVKKEKIEFAKSFECRLVFATYQYMEEGYDDPTLDTLVLSMPRSNVQQVIGRCERNHEGKLDPLILDIVDNPISIL